MIARLRLLAALLWRLRSGHQPTDRDVAALRRAHRAYLAQLRREDPAAWRAEP